MPPLRTMTPVNRMGHISWSGARLWTPAQLTSLAAWYEAGPEYCYQDGAAQFTAASSQYLSRASNSSLQTGDVDFWLAGWFKPTAGSGQKDIITKGPTNEYAVTYNYPDSTFRIYHSANWSVQKIFGVPVTFNQWNFFILWQDATAKTFNIQVGNGTTVSIVYVVDIVASSAEFDIGGREGTVPYPFDGCLDSVCFGKSPPGGIAGVISTISSRLYNSGSGLTYADLTTQEKTDWGLVSFWNLNEASGTRSDSHGTNHLTDNNSVGLAAGIARGQCGDGDPIALWQDRSGNSYHLTQTDILKRPTLRLVNGKWCVRFDGVNDVIVNQSTIVSSLSPITRASAWKKYGAGTAKVLMDGGISDQFLLYWITDASLRSYTGGGYITQTTGLGSALNSSNRCIEIVNAAASKQIVNADIETSGTMSIQSLTGIYIGGQLSGYYEQCDFYGILLTNSVISANEITRLDQYLIGLIP